MGCIIIQSKNRPNFKIVEGDTFNIDMEEFTRDYLNGMTHRNLMVKYNIGRSRLKTLLAELREKGISRKYNPKNYYFSKDMRKWVVSKTIAGTTIRYGSFDTEEEAIEVVRILRENNWGEDVEI